MGRTRDWDNCQTGADSYYGQTSQDAQRQNHAAAVAGDRDQQCRGWRCDYLGRLERVDETGGAAGRRSLSGDGECLSLPETVLDRMRSWGPSARAPWAKSIEPKTPG